MCWPFGLLTEPLSDWLQNFEECSKNSLFMNVTRHHDKCPRLCFYILCISVWNEEYLKKNSEWYLDSWKFSQELIPPLLCLDVIHKNIAVTLTM